MGFKEKIQIEKNYLKDFKRFYEKISFLVLTILIVQQVAFLVKNLIDFKKNTWFSTNNFSTSNLQGYVNRIVGIDSSSLIVVIIAIVSWLLYYVFLYFVVFKFSSKRGMSKWTWSLFVAFGPTMVFVPAYIWFILFAFRNEIYAIFKKVVIDVAKREETEVKEKVKKVEVDKEVTKEEPVK